MNVNSPTIKSDEAPAGSFNPPVPFETADLREMGVEELANLRAVVRMTIDIIFGFSCQPKFFSEAKKEHTPAGVELENFMVWLEAVEMKIMNAIHSADAGSVDEVKAKSWCVLQHEANFAEDLSEFAILAAQAAASSRAAELRARCGR